MTTYNRLPVTFKRGDGVWLWDEEGQRYLDALAGIAVCGLGHAHESITRAISEQAGQLIHTSNLYGIKYQRELAERLCQLSGMNAGFFCNSGAEANEAAIKLARLYGHAKDVELPSIAVMENSFHGRTLATLTATGSRKVQGGFEPLVQGFIRVPFDDLSALEKISTRSHSIVAVLLESIQGEGGIRIPQSGYLAAVRELCNKHQWLMMLDEVQTGMGRTGKWFAYQHESIQPDVVTLAKSLGNGIPIGVCLASSKAGNIFQPGQHGSTFGGNPLACRVATEVIDVIESGDLCKHAAEIGNYIIEQLTQKLSANEIVREIRGKGLMIGIELKTACKELVTQALQKGLLINVTADNVIRLLPPLIIDKTQADELINILCDVITKFSKQI